MNAPRVLLAPVTVTPTKPLSPSHLKGLLWTDVMWRATELVADVTHLSSHITFAPCEQTAGFWEYLDRVVGDVDYTGMGDDEIGELYVRYRKEGQHPTFAALRPYLDAIEHDAWTHPVSVRVLELWDEQYARLGMRPSKSEPARLTLDEMTARLGDLGMSLDLSPYGGARYLDATADGLPLRGLVAADGRPNYLACALRELLDLAPDYDEVVLLYDRELEPDYLLLHRVLRQLGPRVHRVALGRVPIDGRISSARHGDWRGYRVQDLLDSVAGEFDEAAARLGTRLYLIAGLGPGATESFRIDLLRRWIARADRLLAHAEPGKGEDLVARARPGDGHVDPYRLATGLFGRGRPAAPRDLLTRVFT